MTKSKYKQPLESFDPRMMQILIKGSLGRINIPFLGPNGKKLAVAFQRRMQTLRARMRDAEHDQAITVSRCLVRILWGERALAEGLVDHKFDQELVEKWRCDNLGRLGAFISIQPTDLQFDKILSELNLDFASLKQPPAAPDETLSVDDILGELPSGKED